MARQPKTPAKTSAGARLRAERERSSLYVGSVQKAFQVLEAFEGPHRLMTLAEIARAADLDRSATQRLVHTMELLGYIRRLQDSALYGLAPKVLSLSYNYLRSNDLIARASPYLLDISRTLGETTNLQILDGHEIVFIARFPGKYMVNVDFAVGYRVPAAFTASGTAILSRLDDQAQRAVIAATQLNPVTPFTTTDVDALMARIREARELGYAMVTNQTVVGDISVAAAITDHHGHPVGAINISVPTTRWNLETAALKLAPHVQVAATSISQAKLSN